MNAKGHQLGVGGDLDVLDPGLLAWNFGAVLDGAHDLELTSLLDFWRGCVDRVHLAFGITDDEEAATR